MTIGYVLNQRPTTYGGALSLLAEMLVTAGWTYQASGAGTGQSYNAGGKVFTNTGSGTTGWSNTNAWARLQDPGGTREFVFQHDNASKTRIKYSASARFTGGSPAAGVAPSAADERIIWGGGTDASPTFGTWFSAFTLQGASGGGGAGVCYLGAALDTAPYGFWFQSHLLGGSNYATGSNRYSSILMDPVTSVAEDPDPVVIHIAGITGFLDAFIKNGGPGPAIYTGDSSCWVLSPGSEQDGCWAHMDTAKSKFLYVHPMAYVSGGPSLNGDANGYLIVGPLNTTGGWLTPNPYTNGVDMLPVPYMRVQNGFCDTPGMKGWSTMARWVSMATYNNTANNKTWIAIGSFWLPWDGATVPLQ